MKITIELTDELTTHVESIIKDNVKNITESTLKDIVKKTIIDMILSQEVSIDLTSDKDIENATKKPISYSSKEARLQYNIIDKGDTVVVLSPGITPSNTAGMVGRTYVVKDRYIEKNNAKYMNRAIYVLVSKAGRRHRFLNEHLALVK